MGEPVQVEPVKQDPVPTAFGAHDSNPPEDVPQESTHKGLSFWLVICSLCLIAFTASLDGSIIAIALAQISQELSSGSAYVGIANCFVLAQTVVQPAIAQICDVVGRRTPMIASVIVFSLGSGIAGGARNTAAMIAGRTIQGLGSGGIMLLVELIVCDMVPLKERGKYLGIVLSISSLGAIVGPVIGGTLAAKNWRWCFYINLPICGVVLPIMVIYLRIRDRAVTWSQFVTQIDWTGNFIFIGSICSILLGLVFGGTTYPWASWRIIVPLVVGIVGWAVFHFWETICTHPAVPSRVFQHRTSAASFYMIFITSMLLQWVCFFWPVYFLAARGTSLTQTGVDFMPFMFFLIPVSAVAGVVLSKTGQYRPLHAIGFLLSTLGPGLNVLLTERTHTGVWVILEIIDATGRALILPSTLPAVLAPLAEKDVAAATGVYSFLRSFGFVWGITVPSILFNNRFDARSARITDPAVRAALSGGKAYQLAAGSYLKELNHETRRQVIGVYLDALKGVWLAAVGFGASGFVAVLVEKHVPLRTSLETEYGLEQTAKSNEKQLVEPISEGRGKSE